MLNKFLTIIAMVFSLAAMLAFTGFFKPKEFTVTVVHISPSVVDNDTTAWYAHTYITADVHGKSVDEGSRIIDLSEQSLRVSLQTLLKKGPVVLTIQKDDKDNIEAKDIKIAMFHAGLPVYAEAWGTE